MWPSDPRPIICQWIRGILHRIEDDLSETWVEEWASTACASSRRTSRSTSPSSRSSTSTKRPRPSFAKLGRKSRPVAEFKPSYLIKGLPGHPLHPPFTDATIGIYTFATVSAVLSKLGVAEHTFAQAWWLALVVALVTTVGTALTGFADWLRSRAAASSGRRRRCTWSRC